MTVELDLAIEAAKELVGPVGAQHAAVAGRVQARARVGVLNERRVGAPRIFPIAKRHAHAANVQLRRDPGGVDHLAVVVEQAPRLGEHRRAIGDAGPARIDGLDRIQDRPDRRLGGPAQADQRRVRALAPQPIRQRDRDPVAAHQHDSKPAQPRGSLGRGLDQLGVGRDRVPQRDAVLGDQLREPQRIAEVIGLGHDDRAARREQTKDVVDREIKAKRRDRQGPIVWTHAELRVDCEDRVDRAAVVQHHALGLARGARGEDDVGQIRGVPIDRDRPARGELGPSQLIESEGVEPRRPLDGLGLRAHGQRHAGLGEREHVGQAGRWHRRVEGHVGRARQQHTEHRDDLLPTLGGDHRDPIAPLHAAIDQHVGQGGRPLTQLCVVEAERRADHRGPRWLGQRAAQEQPVERAREQQVRGHAIPAARIGDQRGEHFLVVAKQRRGDVGDEAILVDIPEVVQAAVHVEDLVIEGDLGRLRAPRRACDGAQPGRGLVVGAAQVADEAGEHHADRAWLAAVAPVVLAGRVHAADRGVAEVRPQLTMDPLGLRAQAGRAAQIHVEDRRRGEAANHPLDLGRDLRRHGLAAKQSEDQAEVGVAAPRPQHEVEGREQHRRRRHAAGASELLERAEAAGVERAGVASTPGLGRARRPRQARPLGLDLQALDPILEVARGLGPRWAGRERGAVRAEAQLGQRQLSRRIPVQPRPLLEQHHQARPVDKQVVDAQVNARLAAAVIHHRDRKQRPALGIVEPGLHARAQARNRSVAAGWIETAQVESLGHIAARSVEHRLLATRGKHRRP
ncbi:hypothetical protein DB30_03442 [Enhygromyxa salina]|uniref:Uncharacterized protein n=1 Tax=Enhygromyxa salina TaxID=215803 RepID=A0A0C1ZI89_9BACT|nr:hypothetical protein DB30_03442 [Enhygromyxa salina]